MSHPTQARNHPAKGSQLIIEPLRTLEEVNKIKEVLKKHPRNLALFVTGLNVCLRASDLLRLKVSDIDWERNELRVKEKKNGNKSHIVIDKSVMDLLMAIKPENPDGYLFPSGKSGGPMTVSYLNQSMKSWARQAGIKTAYGFGSHTLKKSFIYLHWKYHKTPIEILSKMAGHSSVRITYHYIGIVPEDEREIYLKAL